MIYLNRKTYLEAVIKVYGNNNIDDIINLRDALNIIIYEKLNNYCYINRLKDMSYFNVKRDIVYHNKVMFL